MAGKWSEFIPPVLVVIGLVARLAALEMIVFFTVQSLTDLIGHGLWSEPGAVGRWFDRLPDSVIMDQRALWVFVLVVLVIKGAGQFYPLAAQRLS